MISRKRWLPLLVLASGLAAPATVLAGGGEPAAGDLAATSVTHESAVVGGTVTPSDKPTAWWIEYESASQPIKTATTTVPGDKKHRPVPVSATLSGLFPATQVQARLVVAAGDKRDSGAVLSFRTAAAPAAGEMPATPATPPATEPAAPAEPAPVPALGEQVVAAATAGTVRVRVPGAAGFVAVDHAAAVPVGSLVDATAGTIALRSELPGGGVQQGEFSGARFKVRQPKGGAGRIDLHLRGGSFAGCGRAVAAIAAATPPRKRVRRLWGRDHGGRFRTHGRDSVATVRGTRWSMTDRCDGTVTRVAQGAVDVRNRHTGRVVRVGAGERHVAKHRR